MKQLELDLTNWDYVDNWPHSADPYFEVDCEEEVVIERAIAVCYIIEGHDKLFETREDAEQHRDFLCMTYGYQDGWPISAVSFEYAQ
jgi:hypothetical protein